MKNYILALLFIVFCPLSASQNNPQIEDQIVKKVGQIIQASNERNSDEIWPGFDMSHSPMAISFGNGHVYAYNYSGKSSLWQNRQIDQLTVSYSPQDPWKVSLIPFQAKFLLDGMEAYVFNMDPVIKGDLNTYHVFVHERFHNFQFQYFKSSKEPGHYVDQANIENLTLIQMEEIALAKFLTSQGPSKLEYLRDFLTMGMTRRAIMQTSSVRWEDSQQKLEGMAEYVSFKLFDVFQIIPGTSGAGQLNQLLKQYIASPDIAERAIRWRHYGVGASLGYALDQLGVKNWKKLVEKEDSSLFEILNSALPMTMQEASDRLNEIKICYGYASIKDAVVENINRYQNGIEQITQSYENLNGVEISITAPSYLAISGQGNTKQQLSLPGGTNVSIEDSSVLSSGDQSWRLALKQPYVFQTARGEREFKENAAEVEMDGIKTTVQRVVAEKKTRYFKSIRILGRGTDFHSKGNEGRITIESGRLVIRFK